MTDPVYNTVLGSNATAFRQILELFLPEGGLIADVTFKTGAFWSQMLPVGLAFRTTDYDATGWDEGPRKYNAIGSDLADLLLIHLRADLRHLPYRDSILDAVVLDPPYANCSTVPRRDRLSHTYNLESVRTPATILQLYLDGITEACRVLKTRGLLIVKHQDQVNGGRQQWHSIQIFQHAVELGFLGEDRITVVPEQRPQIRHPDRRQQHSRKWGSEFWIFRKKALRKHAGKPASCKKPVPLHPSGKNSNYPGVFGEGSGKTFFAKKGFPASSAPPEQQ